MPKSNLKTLIQNKLKNVSKLLILGIGSPLRTDDVAGIIASEELAKLCPEEKYPLLKVLIGDNAPENVTGVIKKYAPSHIICIDAADISADPGTIEIINYEMIGGISFSTHTLPLKVMIDYLRSCIPVEVLVIGIQPKTLTFGLKPSKEIVSSAKQVAKTIASIVKDTNK